MPSLGQVYRLTQVAILLAFLGFLVLLHYRNQEQRRHDGDMRSIDELRRDTLAQEQLADELLARSKQKLAEAEAWQPTWIEEPASEKQPKSGDRAR